jgi:DNA sulfur modification protein DndB
MAQQVPAFAGKFGSTDFFVVTMRAGELIRNLTIPKDMEGWEDLTPEERFQREINYKRVANHIAPYLANDEDRFFGAFIVAIHQHDEVEFESILDSGGKFPKGIPNNLAKQFGILYLSGSEVLVPLDGQHRLASLKFAIEGKDNTGKELKAFEANPKVAEDVCTVIMLKNDPQKARKIFNKVNRYAKSTTKADNLITADDDYIAVITRGDIVSKLIDTRIVNITSNTLSKKTGMFTTLATVYEICIKYEETLIGKKVDTSKLPSLADINLARINLTQFWEDFLEISPYKNSLMDPSPTGDSKRAEIREQSVLCKPVVQRAIAEAILYLISDELKDGTKLSVADVVERINQCNWDPGEPQWQQILMNGDKVISGISAMKFAARIIAYLLGQNLEKFEIQKLKEQFDDNAPGKPLPEPFFE